MQPIHGALDKIPQNLGHEESSRGRVLNLIKSIAKTSAIRKVTSQGEEFPEIGTARHACNDSRLTIQKPLTKLLK
jgi:hypothetical protein